MAAGHGIEVELKFRVADPDRVRQAVSDSGGRRDEPIEQSDEYFNHSVRDFAASDEALRVRSVGDTACVTYKGPLLDAETKSREETEIWFSGGAGDGERFGHILRKLGFRPVRRVRKRREPWSLDLRGRHVEVVFDEVEDLGTFIELETAADASGFDEAKAALLELANELGLGPSERRSYLSMLLGSGIGQDSGASES